MLKNYMRLSRYRDIRIILILLISLLIPVLCAEAMQPPDKIYKFHFCPEQEPIHSSYPFLMKPLGIGSFAVGGDTMAFTVALDGYESPVDIYLAVSFDNGGEIATFFLTGHGELKSLSSVTDIYDLRWKTNITSPVSESLLQNTPISSIPPNTYYIDLFVTPFNRVDAFYWWRTAVVVPPTFLQVATPCIDLGNVKIGSNSGYDVKIRKNDTIIINKILSESNFLVNNDTCKEIQSGDCQFRITFFPDRLTSRMADIYLEMESLESLITIKIPVIAESKCNINIEPRSVNLSGNENSGSITVTAHPACSWTAYATYEWIKLTSGMQGSGNGTVSYKVLINDTGRERKGYIIIGEETFEINQSPVANGCNLTIDKTYLSFGPNGGQGEVTVNTTGNCEWTATSSENWIKFCSSFLFQICNIDSLTGSGSRTIKFNVQPNTAATTRQADILIGDKKLRITQSGLSVSCNISISPASFDFPAAGGTGTIQVTAPSGCSWTASVDGFSIAWISITSGSSGTGNGKVEYTVSPNAGAIRYGIIKINNQSFIVNQAAGSGSIENCTTTIEPQSKKFSSSGGQDTITVTRTGNDCRNWTATPDKDWIKIIAGGSGSGEGKTTLQYSVSPSAISRSGVIQIGDKQFTVNQEGVISISPSSLNFGQVLIGTSVNKTVTVALAAGATPITIGQLDIQQDETNYSLTNDNCSNKTISQDCTVTVVFTPKSEGLKSKVLRIPLTIDGQNLASDIPLLGTGYTNSNIAYGELSNPGQWYGFYSVSKIDPSSKNKAPNYGRDAKFYKFYHNQSCVQIQLWLAGTPSAPYNPNMIMSPTDLGTYDAWWAYYYKFYAVDGLNPNNGVRGGANDTKSQYYSSYQMKWQTNYESEDHYINNPANNHTFYIMVVGEDELGSPQYRIEWSCVK